jgi:carboxypeptidase Taq
LQNHFPKQLEKVNLEKFINAINISIPSFIRTEADELTYSIHIIIRYELEKEIFNGKININNLNKV